MTGWRSGYGREDLGQAYKFDGIEQLTPCARGSSRSNINISNDLPSLQSPQFIIDIAHERRHRTMPRAPKAKSEVEEVDQKPYPSTPTKKKGTASEQGSPSKKASAWTPEGESLASRHR